MSKLSVANVYIADGFAEDCNKLIDAFVQKQDLSYDAFCKIFKEMCFIQCFHGRRSEAEIAELSEEVVLISKYFMLHKHHTFAQSVGGLYLLYLMVHLQPFKGFAPLRIVPEDVEPILIFKKTASEGKHYDVLYILGSLLIEGPVEYHIAERPYGLERPVYKYYGSQTSVATTSVNSVLGQEPEKELDLLRQISNTAQNYRSKKDFVMKMTKSAKELNYFQDDFAEETQHSFKNLIKFNAVSDTDESPTKEERNLWALKRRAMKADVKRMRHLNSVNNKNPIKKRRTKQTIKKLNKSKSDSPVTANSSQKVNEPSTSQSTEQSAEGDVIYEFIVVNNDDNGNPETQKLNETDVPIVLDLPMLLGDDIQPSKSGETIKNNTEIVEEVIKESKKGHKIKNKKEKVTKNTPKAVKTIAKVKTKKRKVAKNVKNIKKAKNKK